jgi:hypothetical protein
VPYDSIEPNRIKHLELIQGVIGRLGNDSFLVKGWAVTVAGALIGFGVDRDKPGLALVALVSTLLLWLLDGYYLRSERLFRRLYDAVRSKDAPNRTPRMACDHGWGRCAAGGVRDIRRATPSALPHRLRLRASVPRSSAPATSY